MHAWVCKITHVCMHIHMYLHIHLYTYINAHVHVASYSYATAHMYVPLSIGVFSLSSSVTDEALSDKLSSSSNALIFSCVS